MLSKRSKHGVVFKAISIVLLQAFFVSNLALATGMPSDSLAVWAAHERAAAREMRAQAYRKLFERELSPTFGGKGSWDTILERVKQKIGFYTADSIRLTINDLWAEFIKANKALVDEGNKLIRSDLKIHGKVQQETIDRLEKLTQQFIFPKELEFFIQAQTESLKGWIIDRSSGRSEDSFIRNLAGIFISPKRRDERLVAQGIKEIFEHAIDKIWVNQNKSDKKTIDGVPNILTEEEGFGVVIQPFLSFDASGTAMSNLYGYTAIEAVVGDADMAVRGIYANVAQFLFKKTKKPRLEYNPSFLTTPYQIRLKGKEYSAEKNPESLKAIMGKYPKIKGKFNPLSQKQARELNRVANELENEIGIPLDVEWGFLDGKLYIIQIRPIIGDFKRPLVKKGKNLKGKSVIAETPIALGHTKPKGITGKMALIGSNVDDETIAKLEDAYKDGYIRVQHDVASAVLGGKTNATVLVDPDQGSRQAHNVNRITNRIAEGEFAYCNGPILKNKLLQSLNFDSHPTFRGVWVSEQEVTYFADGLKGMFYKADTKVESLKPDDDYTRQTALMRFHDRVKNTWLKDDVGMPEHAWILETMQIFRYGAHFGKSIEEMFVDMRHEENCNVDFVQRKLLALDYQEADFGMIQHELSLLEEALSFPLYPSRWESPRMQGFRNILFLKDISEKLKEEEQPTQEVVIPQQYVVILLDPYDAKKSAKAQLEKSIEDAQIIRVSSRELLNQSGGKTKILPDQLAVVRNASTISAIYIHLNNYYDFASLFAVLTKIRRENPDALIIVDGNTLYGDEFKRFARKYGQVILKTGEVFEDQELIKLIQKEHLKWIDIREKIEVRKKESSHEKPEYPEKLKVLIIDDEFAPNDLKSMLRTALGEEYELEAFNDVNNAMMKIDDFQPDLIVIDIAIPHFKIIQDRLKTMVVNIGLISLNDEYFSERIVDETMWERKSFFLDKMSGGNLAAEIKKVRRRQIEQYEKNLAEWQKAQPEKPEKPEKLRVLFVDDDSLNIEIIPDFLKTELGNDNYEFFQAANLTEARRILEHNKIDAVLYDFTTEAGERKVDIGGERYTVVFDHGPKLDDRESDSEYFDRMIKDVIPFVFVMSGIPNISEDEMWKRMTKRWGDGARDKIEFDFSPIPSENFISIVKRFKQKQIEAYEKALAEWEKTHKGTKRDKFRLVVIEHPGGHKQYIRRLREENLKIDIEYMNHNDFHMLDDYLEQVEYDVDCLWVHIVTEKQIDFILDYFRKIRQRNPEAMIMLEYGKSFSSLQDKVTAFQKEFGEIELILIPTKLTQYYKEITRACEEKYGEKEEKPLLKPEAKTIFIINNFGQEAQDLAEFIRMQHGEDAYNIITIDSVWQLKRQLAKATPDIVISDDVIDEVDETGNILKLIAERNPNAEFIFTSKEAVIPRKEFENHNVIGVVEKPFYFQGVLDILNHTYEGKETAAKEKYKIEESGRIAKNIETTHTMDKPGIVKIWNGYAAPRLQKSMLTRVRKNTAEGPYKVDFASLRDIVTFACEHAEDVNAITILPYSKLSKTQVARLEESGAKVLYMDFEQDFTFDQNDIVQIGAIVFAGIAYLNNNDNAIMHLYKLLTDKKDHAFVTIDELKKNPKLLMFVLKPVTIHDYNELKRLNHLMEQVLMAA